MEEDDKEATEVDEDEGADKIKPIANPKLPTRKMVEEHERAQHIPYRSWCAHCVRGQARNDAHRRRLDQEEEEVKNRKPIISMDYMYMDVEYKRQQDETYGEKKRGKTPILVIVDSKRKAVFSHMVSQKGGSDDWIIKKVVEDIEDLGYGEVEINIKSDQEVSIVDLQRKQSSRRISSKRKSGKRNSKSPKTKPNHKG